MIMDLAVWTNAQFKILRIERNDPTTQINLSNCTIASTDLM